MRRNFLLMMFALLLLGGCKKDKEVRIYTITEKTPTVDVAVTSVSIRGDYWYPSDLKSVTVAYTQNSDYSSASTILAENHNVYGAGDYYYARLIDLEPNTKYYYYCIFDTGYGSTEGEQWSFTTKSVSATTVTTSSVSNITSTTATCGGNVTSDGGATVTARGVCWGTSQDPTVSNSHTTDGSGTGSFTSNITGLTANTTYYVRAYATNSAGTSYGEQKSFTTQTTPTVTTSSVSNISQTTATCGGNVTSDGGATVTARGVCWSTSQNPTVSDSHTADGSGIGSFTSSITGLTASTTYYVRAYATNSAGTSYGEQESFTTKTVPTVTTSSVSNITQTTATCGGNVISDGGAAVTAFGVCWNTSQNPTVSDYHTTNGSGTGSFTSSITGLIASTTYYVRAYATNSAGTSYGEQRTFTTQSGGGDDHEYVDLGLPSGLLWATCNVGANSPEDYGWYFMWGSVTSGGDPNCNWTNCPGNGGSSSYNSSTIAEWNASHLTDNVLNPDVDAAHANWGGAWRMPTREEFQELGDNTTCTWTTENGVYGCKFTSRTDSGKYIFLPAAGIRFGTDVKFAGSNGYYWSSSLNSSYAGDMHFDSGPVNPQYGGGNRDEGFSVRPVCPSRK